MQQPWWTITYRNMKSERKGRREERKEGREERSREREGGREGGRGVKEGGVINQESSRHTCGPAGTLTLSGNGLFHVLVQEVAVLQLLPGTFRDNSLSTCGHELRKVN